MDKRHYQGPSRRGKNFPLSSVKKSRSLSTLHPHLRSLFRQIGTPSPQPFNPDPFQSEALEKLELNDVLVSAPTGAGKTWIAFEAIKRYLSEGKRAWYTSPLKALSNSKYEELKTEIGADKVGILTGDRKEFPDSPIIVGTTEILRNQLYDAMYCGSDINVDLVVLDEAHYLSDPDRGVVWEEILIYIPRRVKLLLLSATLENRVEIADWLIHIRKTPCSVISSGKRPVPLAPLFLLPDKKILPLSDHRGLLPQVRKFTKNRSRYLYKNSKLSPNYGSIIQSLRSHNLLPAIFFLKSRSDCDNALRTCSPAPPLRPLNEKRWKRKLEPLLNQCPFLRQHRHLPNLIKYRVGSHHGGLLPQWKLLVEKMMGEGLLDAIFATSTVAAGVNFPARTVVLIQSDRYNGREFIDLTATELHQMTGRAGRRGKDKIGFVLIIPGSFQNPFLINDLLSSPPEPIKSQIKINFSMVLNLLLSHRPEEIKKLLDYSLANFQNRHRKEKRNKNLKKALTKINKLLPAHQCDLKQPRNMMAFIKNPHKDDNPCNNCIHADYCHSLGQKRIRSLISRTNKISTEIEKINHQLWAEFKKHLAFLKMTGFVSSDNNLTADGFWASQLRLDQPLLIAESIRRKVFDNSSREILAGLIAAFVSDKTKEIDINLKKIPGLIPLDKAFRNMLSRIEPFRNLKISKEFETPPLQFWPSAALFLWAKGTSWFELLKLVTVEEGDMVMLILRTADHLRQVCNLQDTHPHLAEKTRQILPLILREPVLID